ncbi:MAG: DUF2218 domain-containing protein [Sphingomonadales bacterium]|nr:DUF2218 domain-containing protein [Sphingomonadales bacterium]
MTTSIAVVPTASASRYLQQLCKHWGHKFAVNFDARRGTIALPFGQTELVADDAALTVTIETAEGADTERPRQVVADHLNRFAFREGELVFDWREG